MGTWIARISIVGLYVAVLVGGVALTSARAFAVGLRFRLHRGARRLSQSEGADLTAKVEELSKETLKWNDRIALRNEDMRIFPRCLENPGPNTRGLTESLPIPAPRSQRRPG